MPVANLSEPCTDIARLFSRGIVRLRKGADMPRIETIKASEAPAAPKKMSKVAEQLVTALNGLRKDEVLKVEPDEGKSIRGLKTSVGRISSNAGIKVESWTDQDQTAVYVKKA